MWIFVRRTERTIFTCYPAVILTYTNCGVRWNSKKPYPAPLDRLKKKYIYIYRTSPKRMLQVLFLKNKKIIIYVCIYAILFIYINCVKGRSQTSSHGHDIYYYYCKYTRGRPYCSICIIYIYIGCLTGKKCAVCRCHNIIL